MSNQYVFDEAANKWIAATTAAPVNPTYLISPSYRNVLINGAFAIDQRNNGAAQSFAKGSDNVYTVDRWYVYCNGGTPTGSRVAGNAPNQYNYRLTGPASNEIQFGQRIEAVNSFHLAGQTATLSVSLASSLTTPVTWSAYYANTTDTFGTSGSPTRQPIDTGTFTVTSTLTNYSVNIAIPAAATTGLEIVFSTNALAVSQTLTFAQAQLELGSAATPFERRPIGMELALCQRYFFRTTGANNQFGWGQLFATNNCSAVMPIPVLMRVAPTGVMVGCKIASANSSALISSATFTGGTQQMTVAVNCSIPVTVNMNTGQGAILSVNNGSDSVSLSAEL
jgi:hypothetical protein